jgi:hypothetical protein
VEIQTTEAFRQAEIGERARFTVQRRHERDERLPSGGSSKLRI